MSNFKIIFIVYIFFMYSSEAFAIDKPNNADNSSIKTISEKVAPKKQEPKAELRTEKKDEKHKNVPDGSSPIKVQANSVKYFGNEKRSELIGNVIVVSDNYTLTADKIDIFLFDNQTVKKIICLGNVNFKSDDIVGVSDSADVDQLTQIAILKGGVKVWQGENFLEGEKVTAHFADKRIVVDKGESSRVTIIFKATGDNK